MAAFYVVSLDAYSDFFSTLDGGKKIKFSMDVQGSTSPLNGLEVGDTVVVYNRKPIGQFRTILSVEEKKVSSRIFRKQLEVGEGVDGSSYSIQNLETSNLIKISEEMYQQILAAMLERFSLKFVTVQSTENNS